MADGSALPLEENIAFTKSVVDIAKVFDVDVEGEIGHVGQVAGGFDYQNEDTFTRPVEAARFVERTGVTSVAVAFGSCHGLYKAKPNLDLERLREIDRTVDIPLVLHGGSGIPEDQLEQAFVMASTSLMWERSFSFSTQNCQRRPTRRMSWKRIPSARLLPSGRV